MRYFGIDPGKSGGIAVLDAAGAIVDVAKMPDTFATIYGFINSHARIDECRGALEYVRSRPGMASFATFTFGRNYGALEMALAVARVPYYDVHPLKWQNYLGCRTGGDKNISKARAAELWPGMKITHAIADALLIAEWCRLSHVGGSRTLNELQSSTKGF